MPVKVPHNTLPLLLWRTCSRVTNTPQYKSPAQVRAPFRYKPTPCVHLRGPGPVVCRYEGTKAGVGLGYGLQAAVHTCSTQAVQNLASTTRDSHGSANIARHD
jgi:hypothetical protein